MSQILWYNIPKKYLREKELLKYLLSLELQYKYLNFKYCCWKTNQYLPEEIRCLILHELCYEIVRMPIKEIIGWFKTFIQNPSQYILNPLYTTNNYDCSYILQDFDIAYSLITKNPINNSIIISNQFDLFFGLLKDPRIQSIKIYIRDELFYQTDISDLFEFKLDNIISIDNFVLIDPKDYSLSELQRIININIRNLGRYIILQEYSKNFQTYQFWTILNILPILLLRIPYWDIRLEFVSDVDIDQITLLYGKLRYELAEELKNISLLETEEVRYKYYSLKLSRNFQ